jgi:hypothetical protein
VRYHTTPIIALSEDSGLAVDDDTISVIGKSSVFVFTENQKVEKLIGDVI